MKKIPERTCIVCKNKGDKHDFVRVVRIADGTITLDKTGKIGGRGAYICNNIECLKKCQKTHALNRAFKQEISDEIYQKLIEEYNEQN